MRVSVRVLLEYESGEAEVEKGVVADKQVEGRTFVSSTSTESLVHHDSDKDLTLSGLRNARYVVFSFPPSYSFQLTFLFFRLRLLLHPHLGEL